MGSLEAKWSSSDFKAWIHKMKVVYRRLEVSRVGPALKCTFIYERYPDTIVAEPHMLERQKKQGPHLNAIHPV